MMMKETAYALLVEPEVPLNDRTKRLCEVMGVSKAWVYQWPKETPLPRSTADRVMGALFRKRAAEYKAQGYSLPDIEEDAVSL